MSVIKYWNKLNAHDLTALSRKLRNKLGWRSFPISPYKTTVDWTVIPPSSPFSFLPLKSYLSWCPIHCDAFVVSSGHFSPLQDRIIIILRASSVRLREETQVSLKNSLTLAYKYMIFEFVLSLLIPTFSVISTHRSSRWNFCTCIIPPCMSYLPGGFVSSLWPVRVVVEIWFPCANNLPNFPISKSPNPLWSSRSKHHGSPNRRCQCSYGIVLE